MILLRNKLHFLSLFSLWIILFCFSFWITACDFADLNVNSGESTSDPVVSGGTLVFNLFKDIGGLIGYSFTPTCASPNDYLICTVNIFNTHIPQPTYPLIHIETYSYPCSKYKELAPIEKTGIPCQISCTDIDDTCIWATLTCINTTKGNELTINAMPANISCGY